MCRQQKDRRGSLSSPVGAPSPYLSTGDHSVGRKLFSQLFVIDGVIQVLNIQIHTLERKVIAGCVPPYSKPQAALCQGPSGAWKPWPPSLLFPVLHGTHAPITQHAHHLEAAAPTTSKAKFPEVGLLEGGFTSSPLPSTLTQQQLSPGICHLVTGQPILLQLLKPALQLTLPFYPLLGPAHVQQPPTHLLPIHVHHSLGREGARVLGNHAPPTDVALASQSQRLGLKGTNCNLGQPCSLRRISTRMKPTKSQSKP